jgi:hypothetical protein
MEKGAAVLRMIKEALELKDVNEIQAEIDARKKLINEMCGTLYPSILRDEVYDLELRKRAEVMAAKRSEGRNVI